ncbi:MAG TPA: enoyl-CoA hydratase-related protein [Candidatus Angelobacter sp.]|jgi:2-(1,2-epoxy-1,2-dihydrophenyl)acetyl-CoA isomerase|nr:enoyl-CoA hydratase-related protein [Candidatus Angelobacter sp.]
MVTEVSSQVLAVERSGGVLRLTLNRPQRLNALDDELLDALGAAMVVARDDDLVRAVLITGAGRGFCAGADLTGNRLSGDGGSADRGSAVRRTLQRLYAPLILGIRELEKPVVAAVNGVAAGAGMSLALAADLRVCAESASFIQAFVRIGLVPDAGSSFFLPRLVGMAKAAELAMLGEAVGAAEALRIGLVNRVVADELLLSEGLALASRLAEGPRSVGLAKRALNQSLASDLRAQLGHEEDLQALALASDDAVEGVAAFLQKRPAEFRGR